MFSEPAPIDALIQRMGRVNRYAKRKPAKVRIFEKQLKEEGYQIYDEDIVTKSIEVLSSLNNPLTEEDLNLAADTVYKDGYSSEQMAKYEGALNHPRLREFEKDLIAGTHSNTTDIIIDKMEGKRDLLPTSLIDEYRRLDEQGLRIEANDLMVPTRKRLFGWLTKDGTIDTTHEPWTINNDYSSEVRLTF
jgi:CRISPR-associated endonuclease/helicase Cas3